MSNAVADPTAWANKRRAQILRAEQIRAQRKAGGPPVDDGSYANANLGGAKSKSSRNTRANDQHEDSLDSLAAHREALARNNDIFEQPLPGSRNNANVHPPTKLSPGSDGRDSLGLEVSKIHGGAPSSEYKDSKVRNIVRGGMEGGFKSNFMKQYESPVPRERKVMNQEEFDEERRQAFEFSSTYDNVEYNEDVPNYNNRERKQNGATSSKASAKKSSTPPVTKDDEEDLFLRSLRSDENGGGRSKGKPGWNDDFTTTANSNGLFGDPKPVPKKSSKSNSTPSKVNSFRDKSETTTTRTRKVVSNVGDEMPLPTQVKNKTGGGIGTRGFEDEYPEGYNPGRYTSSDYGNDNNGSSDDYSPRLQPTSTVSPRGGRSPARRGEADAPVAQARSRLSLLKSKIRMSESGGSSRRSGSNTPVTRSLERSNSERDFNMQDYKDTHNEEHSGRGYGGSGSRTAPHNKNNLGNSGGSGSKYSEKFRSSNSRFNDEDYEDTLDEDDFRRLETQRNRDEEDGGLPADFYADIGPIGSRFGDNVYEASEHPGNANLNKAELRKQQEQYKMDYDLRAREEELRRRKEERQRGGGANGSTSTRRNVGKTNLPDDSQQQPQLNRRRNPPTMRTATHERKSDLREAPTKYDDYDDDVNTNFGREYNPRQREHDPHDIYANAADLPGAYPDGEGPPSYTDEEHVYLTSQSDKQATENNGGGGGARGVKAALSNRSKSATTSRSKPASNHNGYGGRNSRNNYDMYVDKEDEGETGAYTISEYAPSLGHDYNAADKGGGDGGYSANHSNQKSGHNNGGGGGRNKPSNTTRNNDRFSDRGGGGGAIDDQPATSSKGYDIVSAMREEAGALPDEYIQQRQCPDCGRSFNEPAFERHTKICKKVFLEKRKTFNSSKMRIQSIAQDDPEVIKHATATKGGRGKANNRQSAMQRDRAAASAKKSKWAEESRQFREAMKNARQVTNALATGAPLPPAMPSAPDSSLIPCPHCGRRFNAKAGERHIPQCQNIKAKPKSLKAHSGNSTSSTRKGTTSSRGVRF